MCNCRIQRTTPAGLAVLALLTISLSACLAQTLENLQSSQTEATIRALQAGTSTARKPGGRPTLADYVPCRFTYARETLLREGNIPDGTDQETLLKAARQPGSGVTKPDLFEKIVKGSPNSYTALIEAQKQNAITAEAAVNLAAQQAPPSHVAPDDVGCSQSVLTWEETRWIFGRKIADNYIAIQVTARNLNGDQEFLIHDLQVAVADFERPPSGNQVATSAPPPSPADQPQGGPVACPIEYGWHTHFLAGRDRVLVRGVGQTGQQFTKRNITERVLEAVGSVFGATAVVAGTVQFSEAVHIFNASAIPGFNKVSPDLSLDQIDRLNDLGFSASSAYKIVIPKNGAVPMTTFLPSAIFAENYKKWSHCRLLNFANNMVVVLGGKHISEENNQAQLNALNCGLVDGYVDLSKASGDNLQCQIAGTGLQLLTAVRLKNADDANDSTTLDGTPSVSGSTSSGSVTFSVKALSALTGKRYQAFGESNNGESTATTRISLPPVATAVTPTDGTAGCDKTAKTCTLTITGKNLDLASSVQLLRSSDNQPVASGTPVPGGSATSQKATFQLTEVAKLTAGDYALAFVSKDGTALPTTVKVKVDPATCCSK